MADFVIPSRHGCGVSPRPEEFEALRAAEARADVAEAELVVARALRLPRVRRDAPFQAG